MAGRFLVMAWRFLVMAGRFLVMVGRFFVMAGLGPAIHDCGSHSAKSWMPAPRAGMTREKDGQNEEHRREWRGRQAGMTSRAHPGRLGP
jgi:hypothetical protein